MSQRFLTRHFSKKKKKNHTHGKWTQEKILHTTIHQRCKLKPQWDSSTHQLECWKNGTLIHYWLKHNCTTTLEIRLAVSYKNTQSSTQMINPFHSRNFLKRNKNICLYKDLHMYIHSSLICNSQNLEITQRSFNRWMANHCGTPTWWNTTRQWKRTNYWLHGYVSK